MPDNQKTALDTFTELSEFGRLANSTDDIDLLLDQACSTVSHALNTDMAKVLERVPENENMLRVKALYGFGADAKEKPLELKAGSAAGYALSSGKPVVSEDIKKETRFHLNEIEKEYGVQSMANVVIPGRAGEPDYGVLEVDHAKPSAFEKKDTFFLQAYANFIAAAVARIKTHRELEESNKKLDDFAYIVAHDLKAPVRGINAFSGFLLEDYIDQLDEEGQNQLKSIKNLTFRMDGLISDLLHYSVAGREKAVMRDVNLDEVINGILELMEHELKQEKVSVTVNYGFPTISCSKANIAEIFRNLIENGIKYNKNEEKKIEIGFITDHKKHPGNYVFFVGDNGIGIPVQYQKTVFKMFKRLHGQEEYGGGTGSGLAIVEKLIDQQNGDIWVESKEGEGSTFFFCLNCT